MRGSNTHVVVFRIMSFCRLILFWGELETVGELLIIICIYMSVHVHVLDWVPGDRWAGRHHMSSSHRYGQRKGAVKNLRESFSTVSVSGNPCVPGQEMPYR